MAHSRYGTLFSSKIGEVGVFADLFTPLVQSDGRLQSLVVPVRKDVVLFNILPTNESRR